MKKFFTLITMLVLCLYSIGAETETTLLDAYQIYVTAADNGKTNSTAELFLNMKNRNAIGTWVCTVELPQGVTFVDGSASIIDSRYPEDYDANFAATVNADGTVKFSCDGEEGVALTGTDGPVATFTVQIADTVLPGDYTIVVLKGSILEEPGGDTHTDGKVRDFIWTIEQGEPTQYSIIFDTDGGSEIAPIYGEAGSVITPPDDPTKEGYTFNGWEPEIPETMPQGGLTVVAQWLINSYTLTYLVDNEEYKTLTVDYGSEITPEEEPTKEGYTFSGWSEIPETMPANDVVIRGFFTLNSYTLTYLVDGEEYKTYTIDYGTEITPEEEPTKEGYTFSGWSEIPETMPATDVVVTGTFNVNTYILTYVVDGEEYKSYEVEYNAAITPEPEPTMEGYTFSGWSEIPETMPAHDVTVTGTFTKDILGKCATPTIGYSNGQLTFNSETEGVTFNYDIDIVDDNVKSGSTNIVQLSVTYHISVYAMKEDYYDSDVATATLCWIDVEPAKEGITDEDAVTEVKALPVLIQSQGGIITIQGAAEGTPIAIYDTSGKQYGSVISEKDFTTISTSLRPGTIAIVKIGEKAVKITVK